MNNVLTAITSIVKNITATSNLSSGRSIDNRMNQMGEALEEFVKNAFADCLNKDERHIKDARNKVFSYLGNSNNPPDAMLKGGAAIEIKKLKTIGASQLQLNSSYPKNKLYVDNPKLCQSCRTCENWDVKDMLYVVGHIDNKTLKSLYFVYGDVYCDEKSVYKKVEDKIKESIESIEEFQFTDTNELGRINGVDHLEITDLRIRGMWLLATPFKCFDYLIEHNQEYNFKLVAIVPTDKYMNFENREEFEAFSLLNGIDVVDEELPDPKNPAELIETKVIKFILHEIN